MTHEPFILVGCDGTASSDAAVQFAAGEARLRCAQLVLIGSYDRPVDPDIDEFDVTDDQLQARARQAVQANFARALDCQPAMLPDHEIIVAEGDPAHVLLKHAKGAVMIVIGSHDHGMLGRLFGRDTGKFILHDTVVPLAVVPASTGQ